ncbi:uncharacterized protein [Channa argus]|uniref:uncharacterized protein isoform X7 n=1 Tax=Channa argus TaxID=215402 RepID=UPI0035208D27
MDLLWMILLVFLVCAEAQNVTEVKVELGQNVTLNCSGDKPDTYWYLDMYHDHVQGFIGRSFNNDPAASQYYVYTLINKYSAFGNNLLITNITAEDCRLYFCGRKINRSIQLVDTFSLILDVPVGPPNNSSMENDDNQHIHLLIRQYKFTMYGSFVLNFLLVTVCRDPVPPRQSPPTCCFFRVYLLQSSASSVNSSWTLTETPGLYLYTRSTHL